MMKRNTGQSRHCGFTLIELLVTMALATVLLTLAVPSFVQYQRDSELTALTNTLLAAINTAKSEAMKTGKNAYVRPIPPNNEWNKGWIVYVDMNRNNAYDKDTDMTVQIQDDIKSYFNITGNGTASGASATGSTASGTGPYIMFNASGYSSNLTLSITRTDVSSGTKAFSEVRRIVVARTGRVRSCKPESSNDANCKGDAAS